MNRTVALVASFCLLWLSCLTGCSDRGYYVSSDEAPLRFSADTVAFETVFSGIGSTTAWLTVFNPHGQTVRLDSVFLQSQGASGFRISVDALPGNGCSGLEIPSGDSLFVFIELTAPLQHSPEPVSLADRIVFRSGEGQQDVVLTALSQDAVLWKGKTLAADTVLTADIPFLIYDSLVVAPGVRLEIGEGTTFFFHDGAMFYDYGTVSAEGSVQKPVVFRGDRLDNAFTDFPYDNYPGQWEGIYLAPESSGNLFRHVKVRGAHYGIIADSTLDAAACKLRLTDSEVFNVTYYALYNLCSRVEVRNSLLANAGLYAVLLIGGSTELIHCTIADYQTLVSRSGAYPALAAVNFTGDASGGHLQAYPLEKVSVINSVIYGQQKDEVGYGRLEDVPFHLSLSHTLIRQETPLDTAFTDNVWYNEDPLFLCTGQDYRYDFRPDSLSAVTDRADTLWSRLLPLDLDGLDRISSDGKADLGAYRSPRK